MSIHRPTTPKARLALLATLLVTLLTACGTRQVQDSLEGSTAQRLVSYAIDDLAESLPAEDFAELSGQRLRIESHFVGDDDLRVYADERLEMELETRFDILAVTEPPADRVLNVFYTSLGTDRDQRGFYLPLGFIPGVDQSAEVDLLTLEQFHGVAEMYYYLGEERGEELDARIRTDSLGLPIITIPLNTLP